MTAQFAFISFNGAQTAREKELKISEAKAHAARAAHRSRKLVLLTAGAPQKKLRGQDVPAKQRRQVPSPWHWTNGTRKDPFNCIPGSDSVTAAIAIDFMHSVVSPLHAAIANSFGVSNLYGSWLLEQMSLYSDVLNVVVASMLSLAGPLMKLAPASDQINMGIFLHRDTALSQLRLRLEGPETGIDDNAILTVIFLAILEGAEQNWEAEKIHRAKAASMVKKRGSSKALIAAPWIRSLSAQFQIQDTLITEMYDFYFLGFDSPQSVISDVSYSEETLSAIPVGFQALIEKRMLSSETVAMVKRLVDRAFSVNPWPQNESHYAELRDFCPAVYCDGLSVDKLICLALVRYGVISAVGRNYRACVFYSVTEALAMAVKTIEPPRQKEYRECLIWIWLVAVNSYLTGGGQIELEGVVLLAQLRSLYPETASWTAEDVEATGRKFLWCEPFSDMVRLNWI